ncbi:MAG TPA: diadenylate cyclase [bacterium]|nr:diadenylate cyclase [bacterium]
MKFPGWFDLADLVDVAIVSVLFYAGLVWFKKTKAFLVVVGIVILGVVYALGRYLNLFLTTSILQSFFTVFLIAIIVIFQEELRQFFERVALWGLGRRPKAEAPRLVEVLVRTAGDLARARIGALVILAGRDPIERHTEGGTDLAGLPSEPLLKSIFDAHTPGHDGAAIIRDGRIERFAVYLPLSKDLEKTAGRGTRHAAALGLSERCDSLAIVVSEERGEVSVARDGELKTLSDISELGPVISDYLDERFPPRKRRRARLVTHNLREKIIAAVLALGLWGVFASTSGVVQRDFMVPIEYSNMPAELAIGRVHPRELTVTLMGDERAFRIFSPEDLKVTVDLSMVREGRQRISIKKGAISRVPRNFRVDSVRPSEIDITLKRDDR